MIFVDRSLVVVPEILSAPDDGRVRGGKRSAAKELRKAIDSLDKWIADGKDAFDWKFKFDIYRDNEIKVALHQLFHGKCAYCESRYAATQPMDVEHWRPKGQIQSATATLRPGYYWLAADWNNLLPSCIDCNRERTQLDAVSGDEMLLGKVDKFPLANDNYADEAGEEAGEVPLLLHPCVDDPSTILEFVGEGVIAPKARRGLPREKAKESIRVYGLNRSELVLQRQEYQKLMELRIATILGLTELLIDTPDLDESVTLTIEEIMLQEMRALLRAREPDQPYALLARQMIAERMEDFADVGLDEHFEAIPDPEA